MARVCTRPRKKKLRALTTVRTFRCCSCRGPEQSLDSTPPPRRKIGQADADHQPVPSDSARPKRSPPPRSARASGNDPPDKTCQAAWRRFWVKKPVSFSTEGSTYCFL